jgi:hypothetical protein
MKLANMELCRGLNLSQNDIMPMSLGNCTTVPV